MTLLTVVVNRFYLRFFLVLGIIIQPVWICNTKTGMSQFDAPLRLQKREFLLYAQDFYEKLNIKVSKHPKGIGLLLAFYFGSEVKIRIKRNNFNPL